MRSKAAEGPCSSTCASCLAVASCSAWRFPGRTSGWSAAPRGTCCSDERPESSTWWCPATRRRSRGLSPVASITPPRGATSVSAPPWCNGRRDPEARRRGSTSRAAAPSPTPRPEHSPWCEGERARRICCAGTSRSTRSPSRSQGSGWESSSPRPMRSRIWRRAACACCTSAASSTTRHACCASPATSRVSDSRPPLTPASWPTRRSPAVPWQRFPERASARSCGWRSPSPTPWPHSPS